MRADKGLKMKKGSKHSEESKEKMSGKRNKYKKRF